MIRIIIFVLVVLGLGYGFAWLADKPDIPFVWEQQRYNLAPAVIAAGLVALIVAILVLEWLIRLVLHSPSNIRSYFRGRKRDRGYQALSTGLIAAGAGNAYLARKMAARAHGLINADREPLIRLLEAQAALIDGRHEEARTQFERMAQDPETRELGLRGLYLEARRLGAGEAAYQYAEKATRNAPHLPWAAKATLEYFSQSGRWDDAIGLMHQQKSSSAFTKPEASRLQAVLLTARANEKLERDPSGARADAMQALKEVKNFVPAALIAAQALFRDNNVRKAASLLESVWKAEPHTEIGELYVRARSGDSALDRLKRAERLESLRPHHIEALLLVGRAALEARDFEKARNKAQAAAHMAPRESAFLLLADIEEAETNDQGRIRHWITQALKASRDPAWVADGVVSDRWMPVSTEGRLDAFEWKVPFNHIEGPVEEGQAVSMDKALESLPPVTVAPSSTLATIQHDPSAPKSKDPNSANPGSSQLKKPVMRQDKDDLPKESKPFFGGAPDDPGVRKAAKPDDAKNRLPIY